MDCVKIRRQFEVFLEQEKFLRLFLACNIFTGARVSRGLISCYNVDELLEQEVAAADLPLLADAVGIGHHHDST